MKALLKAVSVLTFVMAHCGSLANAEGGNFTYDLPGKLFPPGSGSGVQDGRNYAPGIRFPVAEAPAYLNSQVYGIGGSHGPSGSWKDKRNYAYPWRDNFCESRHRAMHLCPKNGGHQGVDIRGPGPKKDKHWLVAIADGRIQNIGSYSVWLKSGDGTRYRYLHVNVDRLAPGLRIGSRVRRGDKIGLMSNYFGGSSTTVHLHFDIKQSVRLESGRSLKVYVPPYMALVESYKKLLAGQP